MAKPYRRKDSRFWWIAPWIEGRQVRQSSGETDYDRAERKLKILEGKLAANAPIKAKTDRGSFAALLELVKVNYVVKGNETLKDTERRIDKHIAPILGHLPAGKVTSAEIDRYILERKRHVDRKGRPKPATNAGINRELAIIRRAFKLGMRDGEVSFIPLIEELEEDNRREGFFEDAHFRAVLRQSNPLLKDILILAFYTGWRGKALLAVLWSQIDFTVGIIRIRLKKNKKSVVFPLSPFPELLAMLEARLSAKKELERRKGKIIPFVFYRANGEKVLSIRTAWELTRIRAGVPGKLIHDFRRTAVRRLKKLGFAESEIMDMVGFKTRAIFDRYDITTEEDILQKAKILASRST